MHRYGHRNFNPRAPYGARLCHTRAYIRTGRISIHAPHTGRDRPKIPIQPPISRFQSTRPIRGATWLLRKVSRLFDISIHAPHTGRDRRGFAVWSRLLSISIHAPHTGRDRNLTMIFTSNQTFQSTRPIRGATPGRRLCPSDREFQSTRPIRGATAKMHNLCSAFLQQQTVKA